MCCCRFLSFHGDDDSLALLKVHMKNAFNAVAMLFLPMCWMISQESQKWCYSQPAELHFGKKRLVASSGVQQGDSL